MDTKLVWDAGKFLEIDSGDSCTTLCMYLAPQS